MLKKKKKKGNISNESPAHNERFKIRHEQAFVKWISSIINKVYFCPIQPNGFGGVSDGLGKKEL